MNLSTFKVPLGPLTASTLRAVYADLEAWQRSLPPSAYDDKTRCTGYLMALQDRLAELGEPVQDRPIIEAIPPGAYSHRDDVPAWLAGTDHLTGRRFSVRAGLGAGTNHAFAPWIMCSVHVGPTRASRRYQVSLHSIATMFLDHDARLHP